MAAIYSERTNVSTGTFSVTHGWDENRITYDETAISKPCSATLPTRERWGAYAYR
ncbi:MAG TPA: hypothetical protein VK668_18575 [Mucilaginibacter sp.]|nr:hypothetical protein [Mucilaginibacter sp.]